MKRSKMISAAILAAATASLAVVTVARAEAAPRADVITSDNAAPVSREEFDALKKDNAQTKAELAKLKPQPGTPAADAAKPTDAASSDAAGDEMDKELRGLHRSIAAVTPGKEELVIAGDAAVGYQSQRRGGSSFSAGFAPLFLWSPTNKLLFEAAMDISGTSSPGNGNAAIDLTLANVSYEVCDNFVIGGGLYTVPFGVYHSHFDPPWINKFADDPMAFSDGGVAPSSETGIFARGAIPVGSAKITYDLYLNNGPNLQVDGSGNITGLDFGDFSDVNNNKAAGGRIGFQPCPYLEVGYSAQYSTPSAPGVQKVRALLQAFDASWKQEINELGGTFDVRGEWAINDLSRGGTYDASGLVMPSYTNFRHGGYAQFCYRPTRSSNKILKNLELVLRYDRLAKPLKAADAEDEQRFTIGLDYWVTPAAVFKVAYEYDKKKIGLNQNAIMAQFGIGL